LTKKLCYVIPEYNKSTIEHYYHIYEFLEEISTQLDVYLVVEKLTGKPDFKNINKVRVLKWGIPFNWLERLFVFVYLRFKGYSTFYIHYSYSSAITASVVTRLLGGRTLYWHCTAKKEFMVKWKPDWNIVKTKLLDDYPFLITLKLITQLVTCTEFMKKYYTVNFKVPGFKIRVMPNWVNLERFNLKKYAGERLRKELHLEANTKVVLFVHWLAPRKGPQHLVEIAQRVRKEVPNVMFMVVGEGPYRETLEQQVRERGLQSTIKLLGGIPNNEIARYYSVADIFIMPSEEEAFGRVLLEAMAMGVPIVANYHKSMDYILSEKQLQFTVKKGDIIDFVKKMRILLVDKALRQELSTEGLKKARNFSLGNVVEIFLELVKQQ
jgi:glycosyltransferase involved in cell wall biosynthesis